jgi:ribonuclease Z
MKPYVQVLGAGSRECASHSLYYFLEQHRILFNVSEGLQRLATQHRLKLSPNKMSAVFLTRLDWECFGGLPGLILTMGDTAKLVNSEESGGNLRIVGPRHAKHAVAAMRPFLHRRDFAVEVEELCVDGGISHWKDSKSGVDVWAYELSESTTWQGEGEEGVLEKCEKTGNVMMEEMEPNHFLLRMFQSEFSVQVSQMEREERCEEYAGRLAQNFSYDGARSLVYVVQGPTQPGKFDRAAALALGIKPGPLFGKLSKGETIVLDDGTVVEPEFCVGPKRSSPAFMILDISTTNLARAAFSNVKELRELMKKPENEKDSRVSVMIHLLGEEVASDESVLKEYREFCVNLCEPFEEIKHFFSAPNDSILMTSSVDLQLALSDSLNANEFFPSGRQPANYLEIPELVKPLDRITVAPEEEISLEAVKSVLSGISSVADIDIAKVEEEGIWVSALGTGSAIPGKYRNVSSSFVENYETDEMIFLDCGEMTIGQVHRLFGPKRTTELLSRTSAILISHKHGDHHLGAISLIRAVVKARGKVLLIAPERFKVWLEEFSQVCDFGLSKVEFVACGEIREEPLKLEKSGSMIKAFEVDHCHEAFGFQITFKSMEKEWRRIVYSGDTRPCDSVIDNAHECDLLVHEATMSNDLLHEAIIRKHCTIEEAINVGVKSKSRALLLTHFSQRYAKGALSLDPSKHENVKVAMGVDLLRFPLNCVDRVSELAFKMSELLPVEKEELETDMEMKN